MSGHVHWGGGVKLATEADEYGHSAELGAPGRAGTADLLFAIVVTAAAAALLGAAVLLF